MLSSPRVTPSKLPKLPTKQGQKAGHPNSMPTRKQRQQLFGIDCCEMVHFHHWEPGGEYQQVVQVKNVVLATQKLIYKLPKTRYFSMEFPELHTLSAGMNWNIIVTFRPVANESYSDVIEFETTYGKFNLPVVATLPQFVLDFPRELEFSTCPVREVATKIFVLHNSGELDSSFEWDIKGPFVIIPARGKLTAGAQMPIQIEFHPTQASVFKAQAVCRFGDESRWEKSRVARSMSVYAVGKYSFLSIVDCPSNSFDFGAVHVGKNVDKVFQLKNHSVVPANFKIHPSEGTHDPYFQFSHIAGIIQPGEVLDIVVNYRPVASGLSSSEYFNISTISGNTVKVLLSGSGIGPNVELSTRCINFNDTLAGTEVTRAFHLSNNANFPAHYQFLVEPNAVFRIDKPTGIIGPFCSIALTVKFTAPTEAINYHRRIFCLVEHQDAQYIDAIATSYNEKRRPATFRAHFLQAYEQRVRNGLGMYGPEQLEDLMKQDMVIAERGILQYVDSQMAAEQAQQTILDYPTEEGTTMSKYFFDNSGPDVACTLLDSAIDFGSCSVDRPSDVQIIRIRNNSKGKMSCVWLMPGESTRDPCVFEVLPKVADIPSQSIVEFRVHFNPKLQSAFYGNQLECFVYYKSMRNFRLVSDEMFTPPWCLTPFVAGNTFPPGQDTFIPKIDFGATRLDFPSCHVDKSVYRTVQVTNTGDTTIKFAFLDDQPANSIGGGVILPTPFSVKPRVGVLHKNESQLVCLRFSPSEAKVYQKSMKCIFNSSVINGQNVALRGVGYYPQLGIEGTLHFKPTCTGARSYKEFTLRNTSRIDVDYQWKIPSLFGELLSIQPPSGRLSPNATQVLSCTFRPAASHDYVMRIPCSYSHDLSGANSKISTRFQKQYQVVLPISARGVDGFIKASPDSVDFGSTLIGSLVEKDIFIYNPTDCDISYGLEIRQLINGKEFVIQNNLDEHGFEVVQRSTILPARSKNTLKLKVCLTHDQNYTFKIYYFQGDISNGSNIKSTCIGTVHAVGVYQALQIKDIRASRMSPSLLWEFFSVDAFNAILHNMGGLVRSMNSSNDFSVAISKAEMTEQGGVVDFDFGARPTGSHPTIVQLTFENTGVVRCEYQFYTPNDLKIDMELWADPGDYTEEQLQNNLIMDHNLFQVYPKSGTLEPGEIAVVSFCYNHTFPGAHRLPMVLKLLYNRIQVGRDVPIHLSGYTAKEGRRCLHFHDQSHTFTPISISTKDAPAQPYRLMNGGLLPIDYELDLAALKTLKAENHNIDILTCLNPRGTVPAGGYEFIDFVFSPLEEKTYDASIPIIISGGKMKLISFSGRGLTDAEALSGLKTIRDEDTVPYRQKRLTETQIAQLSLERLNFGNFPLGSVLRSVIVVRNVSSSELKFEWQVPEFWRDEKIKVSPASRTLNPGESCVCNVVFSSPHQSKMIDKEIVCMITNETEMARYMEQKDALELAKALNVNETLAVCKGDIQYRSTELSKFKTLPPIGSVAPATDKPITANEAKNTNGASVLDSYQLPPPPEPARLFVSVVGRSHHPSEYRKLFDDFSTFYTPTSSTSSGRFDNGDELFHIFTTDSLAKDVIMSTISDILESVIQNPDIQKVSSRLQSEIPFFPQLLEEPRNGIVLQGGSKTETSKTALPYELLNDGFFKNMVEDVLDLTLFNLIREANMREFDLTTFGILVRENVIENETELAPVLPQPAFNPVK